VAPPRVAGGPKPWESVVEDEVDTYWEARNGQIERKKGVDGCRCGPKGMCDYCSPLEVRRRPAGPRLHAGVR